MKILISACLLGLPTRYDGKDSKSQNLIDLLIERKIHFFPLCAEQLGGLKTPRIPCEIEQDHTSKDVIDNKARVYNREAEDKTDSFIKGAKIILSFCKKHNIKEAVLKEKSPSCGVYKVYNGGFDGKLKEGRGILTELLLQNGITVYTVDEFIKMVMKK